MRSCEINLPESACGNTSRKRALVSGLASGSSKRGGTFYGLSREGIFKSLVDHYATVVRLDPNLAVHPKSHPPFQDQASCRMQVAALKPGCVHNMYCFVNILALTTVWYETHIFKHVKVTRSAPCAPPAPGVGPWPGHSRRFRDLSSTGCRCIELFRSGKPIDHIGNAGPLRFAPPLVPRFRG